MSSGDCYACGTPSPTHTHTHTHTYTDTHTYTQTHTHNHTHIHNHAHNHTHTDTHTYTHTHLHPCQVFALIREPHPAPMSLSKGCIVSFASSLFTKKKNRECHHSMSWDVSSGMFLFPFLSVFSPPTPLLSSPLFSPPLLLLLLFLFLWPTRS